MSPLHIALALLVMLIWGLNFAVCKFSLAYLPPFLFTTIRFLISFAMLAPFFKFPWKNVRALLLLSFVFGFGHFGLFFLGLSRGLEAGTASVLMQAAPPMTVLLGALWLKEPLNRLQGAGLLLACAGVLAILGLPEEPPEFLASLMLLGSAALWAISTVIMKEMGDIHPLSLMCWLSGLTTVQIGAVWLIVEGGEIPAAPASAYWAIFFPAVLSTVLAYGLWHYLLKRESVTKLAPFGLLVPFFGVLGGVALLGERFEWSHLFGALLLLLGVACASLLRPRKVHFPQSTPAEPAAAEAA